MSHAQRELDRLALIAALGVLAGAIMGAGALVMYGLVGTPITGGAGSIPGALTFGLIVGSMLGVISVGYLLPLLWTARLEPSFKLVFGVCVPVGIGVSAFDPTLGAFAALLAQVITAVVARNRYPIARPPGPHCRHCGYDCTGVRSDLCPECGWRRDAEGPAPAGVCVACRAATPGPDGRCPICGTLELNIVTEVRGAGSSPAPRHTTAESEGASHGDRQRS